MVVINKAPKWSVMEWQQLRPDCWSVQVALVSVMSPLNLPITNNFLQPIQWTQNKGSNQQQNSQKYSFFTRSQQNMAVPRAVVHKVTARTIVAHKVADLQSEITTQGRQWWPHKVVRKWHEQI